eukprot:COSAG01_NODE_2370_length_7813_cov_9.764325_3_plen_109_part_00
MQEGALERSGAAAQEEARLMMGSVLSQSRREVAEATEQHEQALEAAALERARLEGEVGSFRRELEEVRERERLLSLSGTTLRSTATRWQDGRTGRGEGMWDEGHRHAG